MNFKKLSFVEKTLLKLKDSRQYKDYKFLNKLSQVDPVTLKHVDSSVVSFKHSGHSGDVIYSLPAVKELAGTGKAHIHLSLNMPSSYKGKSLHPLGNVLMNEKTMHMMKPLLAYQPYIEDCSAYNTQAIDFDLDKFREYPLTISGNIARWYFWIFAVFADLSKPWLTVPVNSSYSEKIVIARSFRYRSPGIDYSFLKKYPGKIFVGMPDEFEDMKRVLPDLEYHPVKDFLELASIIYSSHIFVGNQSLPFSLAEGSKARRLLEVCYHAANVNVEGKGGYDFCFQPQFEKVFNELYESAKL